MEKKELKVSAIKDGTVIDHVPAEYLFKVIKILSLDNCKNQITFGTNLESKRSGKKAVIKIADKFFEDNEVSKIALVAPNANLNIIRNYQVVEKRSLILPEEIIGIAKCMNPKCITNNEEMATRFWVENVSPVTLRCHYCEKITGGDHIKVII